MKISREQRHEHTNLIQNRKPGTISCLQFLTWMTLEGKIKSKKGEKGRKNNAWMVNGWWHHWAISKLACKNHLSGRGGICHTALLLGDQVAEYLNLIPLHVWYCARINWLPGGFGNDRFRWRGVYQLGSLLPNFAYALRSKILPLLRTMHTGHNLKIAGHYYFRVLHPVLNVTPFASVSPKLKSFSLA